MAVRRALAALEVAENHFNWAEPEYVGAACFEVRAAEEALAAEIRAARFSRCGGDSGDTPSVWRDAPDSDGLPLAEFPAALGAGLVNSDDGPSSASLFPPQAAVGVAALWDGANRDALRADFKSALRRRKGGYMKILIKRPGVKFRRMKCDNTLEALQKLVGGYIETVALEEGWCFLVDEEGLLKRKPRNIRVQKMDYVQDLMGTVLAVGVDGEDFGDIPEAVAARLLASE